MSRIVRGVEFGASVFEPPPSAWAAPAGAPVLLYGGTFDPPHLAHVELPRRVRDALFGDRGWLVYVPAARNPLKKEGPVASDADRIEMLRLATRGVPRCAVWTDEIDRGAEPSYWVETLARAASVMDDGAPLRFLIGADQALSFDRWRAHETIASLAEPAVVLREPTPTRESFRRALQMGGQDPAAWMGRVVVSDMLPAASTDVRALLRHTSDHPDLDALLDPLVRTFIARVGLYQPRSDGPPRGPSAPSVAE